MTEIEVSNPTEAQKAAVRSIAVAVHEGWPYEEQGYASLRKYDSYTRAELLTNLESALHPEIYRRLRFSAGDPDGLRKQNKDGFTLVSYLTSRLAERPSVAARLRENQFIKDNLNE